MMRNDEARQMQKPEGEFLESSSGIRTAKQVHQELGPYNPSEGPQNYPSQKAGSFGSLRGPQSPYVPPIPMYGRSQDYTTAQKRGVDLQPPSNCYGRYNMPVCRMPQNYNSRRQEYSVLTNGVKASQKQLHLYMKKEEEYAAVLERRRNINRVIFSKYLDREEFARSTLQLMSYSRPPLEIFNTRRKRSSIQAFGLNEDLLAEADSTLEVLAPIRVSIEMDGLILNDTMVWNIFDTTICIDKFSHITCSDLSLPPTLFSSIMTRSIKDQISEYAKHFYPSMTINDSPQVLQFENRFESVPELRIVIKLDITIGNYCLTDKFEWDMACSSNSPEEFANHMCKELNLPLEFSTAIAHCIREQTTALERSLYLVGYTFDGSPIRTDDFVDLFLPTVVSGNVSRSDRAKSTFSPSYNNISDKSQKVSKDFERDARRKRRQIYRSGSAAALPHLEFHKTHRTELIPAAPTSPQEGGNTALNMRRGFQKRLQVKKHKRF